MDEQQALGNFGAKYTLEWRGKNYEFDFIGDVQKSWYVKCMKEAVAHAIDNDENSNDADKKDHRYTFKERVASGYYRWGGKFWEEYRAGPDGQIRLFWMLLGLKYPMLTQSDIEQLLEEKSQECQCIMSLVWADSMINSVKGLSADKKQLAMKELYARLIQPPESGGMGISVEVVAQFTDVQKHEILNRKLSTTETAPAKDESKPYTQEDKKNVDNMLRQYAASQGL